MRLSRTISVVSSEASLASSSPVAQYLRGAVLPSVTVAAVIERALAGVPPGGVVAAFVLGESARGDAQLRAHHHDVAVEWLASADAAGAVSRAAAAIGDGVINVAVIAAVDRAESEWAAVTLAGGDPASSEQRVQVSGIADGATLASAFSRADLNLEGIDLIAPQAADARRAAGMIADWVSEAAFDQGVPPSRTASPVLPATSAARALASVAAVIEALATRTLPPLADVDAAVLTRPFSASRAPRPWISGRIRRAATWSESDGRASVVVFSEPPAVDREPVLIHQPRHLLLLSAENRQQVASVARQCAAEIESDPSRPIEDWSQWLGVRRLPGHRARASILADDATDLRSKLLSLADAVVDGTPSWHTPDGIAFSDVPEPSKTVFLFPGQGAQFSGMFGDLCTAMPGLLDWLDRLQATYPATEYCPPSLIVAPPTEGLTADDKRVIDRAVNGISRGAMVTLIGSLALGRLLRRAGVRADAVVGYSNGENPALVMAGGWRLTSLDELLGLLHVVRLHDEDHQVERGACVAVNQASAETVEKAMASAGGDLAIALENCPDQRVLFGAPQDIARVSAQLAEAGAVVIPMAFDRGHHTPRYQPTVERLREVYDKLEMWAPAIPMYSCVTAAPFPDDTDAIRNLAVGQWARTVRFGATVERLYADGFRTFIEIGPGSTLTGFVRNTLRGKPHTAITTHVARRPGFTQLLQVLGRLFVLGHDVDPARLADPHLTIATEGISPAAASPAVPEAAPASALTAEATLPAEDRAAIVDAHFALMREFLDQQSRVHEWLMRALASPESAAPEVSAPAADMPLLGDRMTAAPGRLVALRRFDPARDVFLRHHTFGPLGQGAGDAAIEGLPVMPFAMSLELAIEAAERLTGRTGRPLQVRQARGTRWLAADRGALDIRVEAQLAETSPDRHEVHVKLYDVTLGDPRPSFEAFVTLDEPAPAPPSITAPAPVSTGDEQAVLYNAKMFHGPLFRRITTIVGLDAGGVSTRAVGPADEGFFTGAPAGFLTSPSLVDAGTQTAAVWLAHHNDGDPSSYPFLLERFVQWQPVPPGTEVVITASVARTGYTLRSDIEFTGTDGRLLANMIGLSMRIFSFPPSLHAVMFGSSPGRRLSTPRSLSPVARSLDALPPQIVDRGQGIWLRTIAARVLCSEELAAWYALDAQHREQWIMRRLAAKEVVLELLAARGIAAEARDLVTEDAGTVIRVRVPAGGNESLGVSVETEGTSLVAKLDGAEAVISVDGHPKEKRER